MTMRRDVEDVQSFERRSSSYEDSLFQRLFFDRIHRVALGAVPAGFEPGRILDIGCGTGRLLRGAARRWPRAHLLGVDPAEGMVAQARRLTPGAEFQVSLAETLSLAPGSADLAFSTASFHHWQDQQEGIRRVADALRAGGLFVLVDIVVPLGLGRLRRHGRQTGPSDRDRMFVTAGLGVQEQRWAMSHFLLVTVGRQDRDPLAGGAPRERSL